MIEQQPQETFEYVSCGCYYLREGKAIVRKLACRHMSAPANLSRLREGKAIVRKLACRHMSAPANLSSLAKRDALVL
jgi:hypothetical protein